ncbi:ABC transporter ATP-binding protein [Candidatus Azambacteria bacterium]|nr:ABC transporter ATP-binding protein [Candidatus Azambacteria bacterium]
MKNLKKIFFNEDVETRAVDGVSFAIAKGEFVSIMGPSGSGKSTLLQVLGFLDRQSSGEYLFEDKLTDEYSDEEIARIRNEKVGFVFQTFNLLPRINVFENVKLPLMYSQIPERDWDKIALDAIKSVGLSHRADHIPAKLSGGERQRVAIARALVNEPDLIFADEPTGNLDSKSGEQVMELISNLNKEGHTIILITHETYTANYAQRIIKIQDGKIVSDERVEKRNGNSYFVK